VSWAGTSTTESSYQWLAYCNLAIDSCYFHGANVAHMAHKVSTTHGRVDVRKLLITH